MATAINLGMWGSKTDICRYGDVFKWDDSEGDLCG